MFTNEGICLWIAFSEEMFMVHSKKFQIEQVTFTRSDLTTFMTLGWIKLKLIACRI